MDLVTPWSRFDIEGIEKMMFRLEALLLQGPGKYHRKTANPPGNGAQSLGSMIYPIASGNHRQ